MGYSAYLPMTEYSHHAAQNQRWILRASINNIAMKVKKIAVSSCCDFEVEEIVCGSRSWGIFPRETPLSDQEKEEKKRRNDHLANIPSLAYLIDRKVKIFSPPDANRAVIPSGRNQLVIVCVNRHSSTHQSLQSEPGINGIALGDRISPSVEWQINEAMEATINTSSFSHPTQMEIEAYLARLRSASPQDRSAKLSTPTTSSVGWDPYPDL